MDFAQDDVLRELLVQSLQPIEHLLAQLWIAVGSEHLTEGGVEECVEADGFETVLERRDGPLGIAIRNQAAFDQDEPGDACTRLPICLEAHIDPETVPDQNRASRSPVRDDTAQGFRQSRNAGLAWRRRVAMAGHVECDDAISRRKRTDLRAPVVLIAESA